MSSSDPPAPPLVRDKPRPKPSTSRLRLALSLAVFDPPTPPPRPPASPLRQQSLPMLSLSTSPSKRPPLGSIHPRSANEVRRHPSEEVAGSTGKAREWERRRSISTTALASWRGVTGAIGGSLGKKKSSSSLRAQVVLTRGREEGGGSLLLSKVVQEQRSTFLPLVETTLPTSKESSFSDSLELDFDQIHLSISHSALSSSPPAPPPPALVPAQAPPSPSSSIVTHSTSLYHSCNSSLLASTPSSSGHTVVASNDLLPCCIANRAVLPYHLQFNELDRLHRSGSSSTDDENTPQRAGQAQDEGAGEGGEGRREGGVDDASKKWSPPYVREWSPSSGDSPAFAIGDNPFEGKARQKLVARGIVKWSLECKAVTETEGGKDVGDEDRNTSPTLPVEISNDERAAPTSPSSPSLRYSLQPDCSPSSSSLQNPTRTPSPLQFTSANSVDHGSSLNASTTSSTSSIYSQTSFVPGAILCPRSPKSDDERTERDDASSSPSPLPTPSLPTSPLPNGLRYAGTSPTMQSKSSLPLSPPPSADMLAQMAAGSPYGPFAWDRGGPESPDEGMSWFWRRGETASSILGAPGGQEEEEERSEADTSGGGYLGEGEVSFATSEESFDPLASPSARFSSLNRLEETPPQSPVSHRRRSEEEQVASDEDEHEEEPGSHVRPPTRRNFVRSPGAPSPSPTRRSAIPTSSFDLSLSPPTPTPTSSLIVADALHQTTAPSSAFTYPRPLSRPLPPTPQSQLQTTPISNAPRIRPRGGARPRSMHEQIHRAISTAPVTSSSSGLFIPHALTPIKGSPSSLQVQETPPTSNGLIARRSTHLLSGVEGGLNRSPLAGKRRGDGPSSLVGEREREGWEDVTYEIEAMIGYGKIREMIKKTESRAQEEVEGGGGAEKKRVPTLRKTKKRRSLLGEEGSPTSGEMAGGGEEKVNAGVGVGVVGEVWPLVKEGGEGVGVDVDGAEGVSSRGSLEVRSTKVSDFGGRGSVGGAYLRRLERSEVTLLAEESTSSSASDNNSLKKRPSASSLKALFERRPSLGNIPPPSNASNSFFESSVSRSGSFSSLFSLTKRRTSPSPSPSPSPSIEAFDFEEVNESLFEEAKKNRELF